MANLDDAGALSALDPSDVLGSTGKFPDQCEQAWKETSSLRLPASYSKVKNIAVCGMGGSRFTPRSIKELYFDTISVPYEIVEGYQLPGFVDKDSLVILSSFSGTTEEVITCGETALKRGAKVLAICGGGKIAGMAKAKKFPAYVFDPIHNPCNQPRIGGGYLLMGHLGLLKALGFLKVTNKEVEEAIRFVRTYEATLKANIPISKNDAKKLALKLVNKHPFIITAEFLRGFGNGFANQINETTKTISDYRYIPELNHHLMEGLTRPESLHKDGIFVFIESKFYTPSVIKRFKITKEVVAKQKVTTLDISLTGPTKLAQVLEAFTASGFVTFYMAAHYDTDPVAIPWVDYFKAQLKKQ